ncbi:hypothetical protein AcW1_003909 [Taiwanofungus camphoratus]|nr:hypothetical protein AcW1_003909 [Antrodia cinnamomea]
MSATVQNSSDKLEPSTGMSDASLSLEPTMDHVIRDCPRFRILIVGKSGVGKSSLINEIFKAKLATVTDYTRGPASIEEEITSEHNDRFVLHDSRGFEAGEADHFNIVKGFIEERSESDDIHKKLHAIWLCIATPIAGGRILERGDDKLLELKLKSVPIIVVFTKYDELVTRMDIELQGSTLDAEKRSRKARKQAARLYKDDCVRPLREAIKNNTPPIVNVAVASGYEQSVENLIQATVKAMYKRTKSARSSRLRSMMFWSSSQTTGIGMDPQGFVKIMTATAQRIALGPKILASIEVGRKRVSHPAYTSKTSL